MQLAKRLAMTVVALTMATAPALAADPTGTWQSVTGESRYQITYCGGSKLCAKLTWLRADARTADNLPYLNHYVVKGAVPQADGEWSGTLTYNGDTYSGLLTMLDQNSMKLQGCKGLFCQSMRFTRI
jgi:uncharacterized protein (DUF2147 family)